MTRIVRTAAWLLLATIVVLSVVPAEYRPVTAAPQFIGHLAIFFPYRAGLRLRYHPYFVVPAAGIGLFSAPIEVSQLGVPARHARFGDFVVDTLSALLGIGLAAVAVWAKEYVGPHCLDE